MNRKTCSGSPPMDPCSAQNTWEIFPKAENKHSLAVTVIGYPSAPPLPITIHPPHLFKTKINTTWEPIFARHTSSNPVICFIYLNLACVDSPVDLLSPVRWPMLVFYPESSGWVLFCIPDLFQGDISLCDKWVEGFKWLGGRGELFLICVSLWFQNPVRKSSVIWAARKCGSSFQIYNCKALDKRQVTNPCLK